MKKTEGELSLGSTAGANAETDLHGEAWQPIETAPLCERWEAPKRVLLYGAGIGGVCVGRALRHANGWIHVGVPHVNGNLALTGDVTHWMPLPSPPLAVDGGTSRTSTEPQSQATTNETPR